jgi:hypothetical protein
MADRSKLVVPHMLQKTIKNKNNSKLRNLKSNQTAVQHSNSSTSGAFFEPTHDILFEKKIREILKISNFFRFFQIFSANKILRIDSNEPHDQGELKNHDKQNFKCWPAVGMRFQIP